MTTIPWRLDPRSTLRPDPAHWEMAEPSLRAILLSQGVKGSYVGLLGRFALRAREVVHALLTNAGPAQRVSVKADLDEGDVR